MAQEVQVGGIVSHEEAFVSFLDAPFQKYCNTYTVTKSLFRSQNSHLSLLDLGCGNGRFSMLVAQKGGNQVVGVDISQHFVDTANNQARVLGLDKAQFLQGNFMRFDEMQRILPIADYQGSFDTVLCNFALYSAKTQQELSEVAQIISTYLAPDGLFIGMTVNPNQDTEFCSSQEYKTKTGIQLIDHTTDGNFKKAVYRFYSNDSYFDADCYYSSEQQLNDAFLEHNLSLQIKPIAIDESAKEDFPPDYFNCYIGVPNPSHAVFITAKKISQGQQKINQYIPTAFWQVLSQTPNNSLQYTNNSNQYLKIYKQSYEFLQITIIYITNMQEVFPDIDFAHKRERQIQLQENMLEFEYEKTRSSQSANKPNDKQLQKVSVSQMRNLFNKLRFENQAKTQQLEKLKGQCSVLAPSKHLRSRSQQSILKSSKFDTLQSALQETRQNQSQQEHQTLQLRAMASKINTQSLNLRSKIDEIRKAILQYTKSQQNVQNAARKVQFDSSQTQYHMEKIKETITDDALKRKEQLKRQKKQSGQLQENTKRVKRKMAAYVVDSQIAKRSLDGMMQKLKHHVKEYEHFASLSHKTQEKLEYYQKVFQALQQQPLSRVVRSPYDKNFTPNSPVAYFRKLLYEESRLQLQFSELTQQEAQLREECDKLKSKLQKLQKFAFDPADLIKDIKQKLSTVAHGEEAETYNQLLAIVSSQEQTDTKTHQYETQAYTLLNRISTYFTNSWNKLQFVRKHSPLARAQLEDFIYKSTPTANNIKFGVAIKSKIFNFGPGQLQRMPSISKANRGGRSPVKRVVESYEPFTLYEIKDYFLTHFPGSPEMADAFSRELSRNSIIRFYVNEQALTNYIIRYNSPEECLLNISTLNRKAHQAIRNRAVQSIMLLGEMAQSLIQLSNSSDDSKGTMSPVQQSQYLQLDQKTQRIDLSTVDESRQLLTDFMYLTQAKDSPRKTFEKFYSQSSINLTQNIMAIKPVIRNRSKGSVQTSRFPSINYKREALKNIQALQTQLNEIVKLNSGKSKDSRVKGLLRSASVGHMV